MRKNGGNSIIVGAEPISPSFRVVLTGLMQSLRSLWQQQHRIFAGTADSAGTRHEYLRLSGDVSDIPGAACQWEEGATGRLFDVLHPDVRGRESESLCVRKAGQPSDWRWEWSWRETLRGSKDFFDPVPTIDCHTAFKTRRATFPVAARPGQDEVRAQPLPPKSRGQDRFLPTSCRRKTSAR